MISKEQLKVEREFVKFDFLRIQDSAVFFVSRAARAFKVKLIELNQIDTLWGENM